jgi:hypothetical protein
MAANSGPGQRWRRLLRSHAMPCQPQARLLVAKRASSECPRGRPVKGGPPGRGVSCQSYQGPACPAGRGPGYGPAPRAATRQSPPSQHTSANHKRPPAKHTPAARQTNHAKNARRAIATPGAGPRPAAPLHAPPPSQLLRPFLLSPSAPQPSLVYSVVAGSSRPPPPQPRRRAGVCQQRPSLA